MSNKQPPKNFYCDIPVADEDIERFKKGCEYYQMTCTQKRGQKPYFTVGTDDILNLYWLAANLFGKIEHSSLCKRAF